MWAADFGRNLLLLVIVLVTVGSLNQKQTSVLRDERSITCEKPEVIFGGD